MELTRLSRRPGPRTAPLALLALLMMLAAHAAPAATGKLALRPGMGGVPDIGAIACATFNDMYPAGPSGVRQAVLYWTEGFVFAKTGRSIDEQLAAVGGDWDFESLTGHVVGFCAAHPEMPVSAAVVDLWGRIGG
jgi:hypothetical protein